MDEDIRAFAEDLGAIDLREIEEMRSLFKRSNYFWLDGSILVIKISRSARPFWGVRREIIERLNQVNGVNYYLVLLTSSQEGFLFDKSEVNTMIRTKTWNLALDDNYKINWPLPMRNGFTNPRQARMRIIGAN